MKNELRIQNKVLTYLLNYSDQNGYMPTYREIKQGCGLASNYIVEKTISELEEDGHLRCAYTADGRHIARAMWITEAVQ